jgi:EAL domain-containing protein (putative c-di-GMP-specific phosphodiesterase class I)
VCSIVALAEALDLSVTAEGIETAAQQTQFLALGCDCGQGYLFAKPLAPNELVDVLSRGLPRFTDSERAAA